MSRFSSGKITSTAIFYDRGVPPTGNSFGIYPTINFEILKQIYRHNIRNNIRNNRPFYSFTQK
uniref:Uncharacterized protein n=1 Tax=viral metagenome TaxID=1070528 RepID=A0A6C0KMC1_9ZZZZ